MTDTADSGLGKLMWDHFIRKHTDHTFDAIRKVIIEAKGEVYWQEHAQEPLERIRQDVLAEQGLDPNLPLNNPWKSEDP